MAIREGHATPRSPRDVLGPGADVPLARIVALLLILLPIGAWFLISNVVGGGPSQPAIDLTNLNPRTIFTDTAPHFLPTPVAALPPQTNAAPPASAADKQATTSSPAVEHVKVANTGGAGAILRADPPRGRQVAGLRDGTLLQVLEHQQQPDGSDWLHVRTPDGTEGWVFSSLVVPSD